MNRNTYGMLKDIDGVSLALLLRAPYDRPAPVPAQRHRLGESADEEVLARLDVLVDAWLVEYLGEGARTGQLGRGATYRCTEAGERVRNAFLQSARLVGLEALDPKPNRKGERGGVAPGATRFERAGKVDPDRVLIRAGHPARKEGLYSCPCEVCGAGVGEPCKAIGGEERFAGFMHAGRAAYAAEEVEGS